MVVTRSKITKDDPGVGREIDYVTDANAQSPRHGGNEFAIHDLASSGARNRISPTVQSGQVDDGIIA
jgi:hypothetical protein